MTTSSIGPNATWTKKAYDALDLVGHSMVGVSSPSNRRGAGEQHRRAHSHRVASGRPVTGCGEGTMSGVKGGATIGRLLRPMVPFVLKSSMGRRLWFQTAACSWGSVCAEAGAPDRRRLLENARSETEIFSTDDEQIAPLDPLAMPPVSCRVAGGQAGVHSVVLDGVQCTENRRPQADVRDSPRCSGTTRLMD